jgi:hypothetical protein
MMSKFNNWLAVNSTLAFGTMWMFYVLIVYSFAAIVFPAYQDKILYWSNAIQLVALPLIMVGTNLLGKTTEQRNLEMYNMITSEIAALKDLHADTHALLQDKLH